MLLEAEGFRLSSMRESRETGVDIIASRSAEDWHIEVVGYKSLRLNDGAEHCVIALARRAKVGLPARARQYGVAWKRIGQAFPELEIWLVDVDGQQYEKTTWLEWLR